MILQKILWPIYDRGVRLPLTPKFLIHFFLSQTWFLSRKFHRYDSAVKKSFVSKRQIFKFVLKGLILLHSKTIRYCLFFFRFFLIFNFHENSGHFDRSKFWKKIRSFRMHQKLCSNFKTKIQTVYNIFLFWKLIFFY